MRLVVDTNVFVSATFKRISWLASVVRWIARHGGLLKSLVTEQELVDVLQRPRLMAKADPDLTADLRRLLAVAELITISEPVVACRDPKDDKFLELAVNGSADIIISGDTDLLTLNRFRGIPILDAATFSRLHV